MLNLDSHQKARRVGRVPAFALAMLAIATAAAILAFAPELTMTAQGGAVALLTLLRRSLLSDGAIIWLFVLSCSAESAFPAHLAHPIHTLIHKCTRFEPSFAGRVRRVQSHRTRGTAPSSFRACKRVPWICTFCT